LTGGGATTGDGTLNLLTSSYPRTEKIWAANAQDHAGINDPRPLTVYAIGIKRKPGSSIVPTTLSLANTGVSGTKGGFSGASYVGLVAVGSPVTGGLQEVYSQGKTLLYTAKNSDTIRRLALEFASGNLGKVMTANPQISGPYELLREGTIIEIPLD